MVKAMMITRLKNIQTISIDKYSHSSYLSWATGIFVFLFLIVFLLTLIPLAYGPSGKETLNYGKIRIENTSRFSDIFSTVASYPGLENPRILTKNKLNDSKNDYSGVIDFYFSSNLDLTTLKKRIESAGSSINFDLPKGNNNISPVGEPRLFIYSLGILATIILFSIIHFFSRSFIMSCEKEVSILRLIGAKDSYITKHFEWYIVKNSLKGCFSGIISVIPLLACFQFLEIVNLSFLFYSPFFTELVIAILIFPFFIAFFSLFITKITILKALIKMGC